MRRLLSDLWGRLARRFGSRTLSPATIRAIARAHQRERGDGMLEDVRFERQLVPPDLRDRVYRRMGLGPEAKP